MNLSFKEQAAIAAMQALATRDEYDRWKPLSESAWEVAEFMDAERKRRVPGAQGLPPSPKCPCCQGSGTVYDEDGTNRHTCRGCLGNGIRNEERLSALKSP